MLALIFQQYKNASVFSQEFANIKLGFNTFGKYQSDPACGTMQVMRERESCTHTKIRKL